MGPAVELINSWIWPVALAPAIGSFLGVLVRRLPQGQPVLLGRSHCETCGHTLTPREMVPLLSYLLQRGHCRACGAAIAPAHAWIELAALAVAGVSALLVPGGVGLWLTCALGWWLLTLAWIDAEHFRLPDVLTLPLVLAGLAEAAWLAPDTLTDRAIAAFLGFTALWALRAAYRRLRAREGLGLGDAKLLAAGGAWVGVLALPYVILTGALLALGWALILRLRGTVLAGNLKLPFGPFLAAGIWVLWVIQ
jgi:leader peptidase (prepilin peptidase)/N-methyltransferase